MWHLNLISFGLVAGQMKEIGRVESTESYACDRLAACPYVYVMTEAGAELVGEILRDVRGSDAYATQDLALPMQHGTVHVQLREEKKEVTYLDSIALVVDGREVLPTICSWEQGLPHCAADGDFHRMFEGDVLDLWFTVPDGASSIELRATGYYIPTPTIDQR